MNFETSKRCCLLLACLAIPFGNVLGGNRNEPAVDNVTKETIVAAWKASSERLKAARFEFETTTVATKERVARLDRAREMSDPPPVKIVWKEIDPTHVQIVRRTRVNIDGDRVRWESFDELRNTNTSALPIQISTSNGIFSQFLGMPMTERSRLDYPAAHVKQTPLSIAYMNVDSRPVRLAMAKLPPETPAITLDEFRIQPESVEVGSVHCVVAAEVQEKGPVNEHCLDPGKDFAIVRSQHFFPNREHLLHEIDFTYRQDEKYGWIPTGWTISIFGKDKSPEEVRTSRVLSWESNPTFRDDEFEIAFPPDTKFAR